MTEYDMIYSTYKDLLTQMQMDMQRLCILSQLLISMRGGNGSQRLS